MQNFTVFTHLETFHVIARLAKQALQIPEDGLLVLREVDAETQTFKDWKSLQSLLSRARKAIKSPEDLGAVFIERLKAGVVTPWTKDLPNDWHTFRIPLVTNPGATEYCRNEMVHMPVGSLWWTNTEDWASSANWGTEPRYHLVFELCKPGVLTNGDPV
jgi:hypothetical protein